MTIQTVTYPIAPAITPWLGTLLDAATVQDGIDWQNGEGLFDSYNCMKFQESAEFCDPTEKVFDNTAGWQDGLRFAAYGGAVCKAIGLDQPRMQSEVQRVFEAGESVAVERALMAHRFAENEDDDDTLPGTWDAPVDITPTAGAVRPALGLALLEGYSHNYYVGMPTLHLPTMVTSLLLGSDGPAYAAWAERIDGGVPGNEYASTPGSPSGPERTMRTKLGSKIANGGGYDYPNLGPDGVESADGEKWIYATGEVLVLRGEPIIRQVMAHDTNEVFVLAERPYVVSVDCFAAAVRVQVSA